MTVSELIEILKEFDGKTVVGVMGGLGECLHIDEVTLEDEFEQVYVAINHD